MKRGLNELRYVAPGDHEVEMRAFYRRELPRRGWRYAGRDDSVDWYQRVAVKIGVTRDWMDNSDPLVKIF